MQTILSSPNHAPTRAQNKPWGLPSEPPLGPASGQTLGRTNVGTSRHTRKMPAQACDIRTTSKGRLDNVGGHLEEAREDVVGAGILRVEGRDERRILAT